MTVAEAKQIAASRDTQGCPHHWAALNILAGEIADIERGFIVASKDRSDAWIEVRRLRADLDEEKQIAIALRLKMRSLENIVGQLRDQQSKVKAQRATLREPKNLQSVEWLELEAGYQRRIESERTQLEKVRAALAEKEKQLKLASVERDDWKARAYEASHALAETRAELDTVNDKLAYANHGNGQLKTALAEKEKELVDTVAVQMHERGKLIAENAALKAERGSDGGR